MDPQKALILSAIGGLAGLLAFEAYQVSELTSALIVLFIIAWFFHSFIGWGSLWNLISLFKNPFMAAILIAGLGFTYWTYSGNLFPESSLFGFGMLFIGAALGSWFYMYWNIGG